MSDFGLAKAMNTLGFASQNFFYTKQLPPETFISTDKTLHYDIYLAGLTIYRLLNGEDYFNNQLSTFKSKHEYIDAVKSGNFPNRNSYLPHIPIKLQRIVNKAISVDIKDRHQNVLELINELSDVEENLDWRYKKDNSVSTWTRDNETHTYQVQVDFTNSKKISILTTKTNIDTGKSQRQTAHCHNNLRKSNVLSNIKAALKI